MPHVEAGEIWKFGIAEAKEKVLELIGRQSA